MGWNRRYFPPRLKFSRFMLDYDTSTLTSLDPSLSIIYFLFCK